LFSPIIFKKSIKKRIFINKYYSLNANSSTFLRIFTKTPTAAKRILLAAVGVQGNLIACF